MSVFVVRAFVSLRETLAANRQLAVHLAELERRLETHDEVILDIISTIRKLAAAPRKSRRIGFQMPAKAV